MASCAVSKSHIFCDSKLCHRKNYKICDIGYDQSDVVMSKRRKTGSGAGKDNISDAPNGSTHHKKSVVEKGLSHSPSNLVFGYLNLFSDGVNFNVTCNISAQFYRWDGFGKFFPPLWISWWVVNNSVSACT
ncbi:hypothetical protein HYC85_024005 [Camellia sinensis]|uniref:Uncharacterized protein n=1 Tax=Camellia sinensis TaxID=4442 RepID=A0A7J7GJZ6_CAMSI|nr:hypothetical protein HYC85_024005 [Camellia sinensis]